MSKLRQHGLTMIEVALAVMISTLVMTAVWLQLQDIIKFYLSRNTAYTINARFDHVIDDIKSSCLIIANSTSCDKSKQIRKIEMENSSGGVFGELNVNIQPDNKTKKFDIWITYNIKGSILQHLDRRTVRNNTAFYYVAYCDVIKNQKNEDGICKSTNKNSYYYSPVMPWSVSSDQLDWLNKTSDDYLIFHYVLSL
ncbi:TPA: type II secretion system protein J [Escherichia coli]